MSGARRTSWSRVVAVAGICVACSSGLEQALSPSDFVGLYPLAQVDGHNLGWYHQLGAVDCSAAFTSGTLTIGADSNWRLSLDYKFRCIGVDPYDGTDRLVVLGSNMRTDPGTLILIGKGPDLVYGGGKDWSITVRPQGDHVDVRFGGDEGEYWAFPVLTMGPKEPIPGS